MLSAIAPIPSTLQVQAQPQLDSFKHTPRRCVNNAQQKTDRWSGKPCLSTRMLIFIPLTFFPPSIPRFPQVGDDRQDRLSATRTEGLDLSPQATRHLRRRSTTRPFQRPRRFHRAKQEYIVVKGIPVSNPIVRHCMPP